MLETLRDPHYRLLWLAGLAAHTARWMDVVVLGWLALSLTDSPVMVGVAAFCRSAPMMVLGPFAGVLADRFPRGRVMLGVQALNLATASALALAFATGLGGFRTLVTLEALLGVAWAVDFPARRTTLLTLVGRERLTKAISLETVSMQGAKMVGPLLGGLLLARLGPAACYVALALLSAGALVGIRRLERAVPLPGAPGAESVLASLGEGLREVRGRPAILGVLGITVAMNSLVFPYQLMLAVFARDVLGVGPELLGLLVAADAIGALIGSLVLATRRAPAMPARIFIGSSLAAAALLIGFAASPWYLLSLALQAAIGLAESGFATFQSAIVLLAAPPQARGRAMGILSACIGTQPLGTLWIGFLVGRVGAPLATSINAAGALLLMLPLGWRMIRGDGSADTRVVGSGP